jgi:hypothetical protein
LEDYARIKGKNIYEKNIHPEAKKWLVGLDPFELKRQLEESKIHPTLVEKAVKRLLAMQSTSVLGQNSMGDILSAHKNYGV